MKFSDILSRFKQGKTTAHSHMKNLIEIAAADGHFDNVEDDLLSKIAKRNGIGKNKLEEIKAQPNSVDFEVPEDSSEKFSQLFDLVHMMIVDDEIHPEEMKLCNLYAIKFGYNKNNIDELIATIKSNIENKQTVDDTEKRIAWMLN